MLSLLITHSHNIDFFLGSSCLCMDHCIHHVLFSIFISISNHHVPQCCHKPSNATTALHYLATGDICAYRWFCLCSMFSIDSCWGDWDQANNNVGTSHGDSIPRTSCCKAFFTIAVSASLYCWCRWEATMLVFVPRHISCHSIAYFVVTVCLMRLI